MYSANEDIPKAFRNYNIFNIIIYKYSTFSNYFISTM